MVLSKPLAAAPYIGASAYCLVDMKTGQILLNKNAMQNRPPASTTKIMTGLLALEYLDLDDTAVVSRHASLTPPSAIGLREGDEMKVRDLLTAALLRSANDACVVLAEETAGSEELFAYLMNKKAFLLGATASNFVNSNGLPAKEHTSSCYDLFLISRAALQVDWFAHTVSRPGATIQHPHYPQGKLINNTNRLLSIYPGAKGIKTGTTNAAGQCLVGLVERDKRQLISIVLGSGERYQDSIALYEQGFKKFRRTKLVDHRKPFKVLRVVGGRSAKLTVYPRHDIWVWLMEKDQTAVNKVVLLNYNPKAPIQKGDKLGTLQIYYNGDLLDNTNLIAGGNVVKSPEGIMKLLPFGR
ncbi:MAG: D-alanyl-D-alanine carboxypeptidase family protein [Ignavibacteriales bacterium]